MFKLKQQDIFYGVEVLRLMFMLKIKGLRQTAELTHQ